MKQFDPAEFDESLLSIVKDDPVVLAPKAPLILQAAQLNQLSPQTNETQLKPEYAMVPMVSKADAVKFMLFVVGSYITMVPVLLTVPSQITSCFGCQEARTLLCALLIWNLIGAALFCRTKLHRDDLFVVLIYILSTPLVGISGLVLLPILCGRAVSPLGRSIDEVGNLRTQLLLLAIFGMPAILWPLLLPAILTIIGALKGMFGWSPL